MQTPASIKESRREWRDTLCEF